MLGAIFGVAISALAAKAAIDSLEGILDFSQDVLDNSEAVHSKHNIGGFICLVKNSRDFEGLQKGNRLLDSIIEDKFCEWSPNDKGVLKHVLVQCCMDWGEMAFILNPLIQENSPMHQCLGPEDTTMVFDTLVSLPTRDKYTLFNLGTIISRTLVEK